MTAPRSHEPTADAAERAIYQHILSRNPEHDFEPTLDRVREACALLGDPQHAFKVVHLTGTNGKTSTARMVEALVREHGLRTGLFTSPHLTSVRERIQIDGEPIDQAAFVQLWDDVHPILEIVDARSVAEGGPRLSFFEVLTVLAFAAFADAPVEVAVIEVGMGGVWDATNLADADVAVITPIGLDHQQWLGDDIRDIATEKAGIIKPGCVAVIAAQDAHVTPILADAVAAAGARVAWESGDPDDDVAADDPRHEDANGGGSRETQLQVLGRQAGVGGQLVSLRTSAATYTEVFVPLYGEYQAHNALLALAATEWLLADGGAVSGLDGLIVEAAFNSVTSPGRLEIVRSSPMIVVDAAHNPHGINALVGALGESFSFTTLVGVVGILEDKDAEGILAGLERVLDHVVVTSSSSSRARPVHELAAIAATVFGEDRVSVESSLPAAIDAAVTLAEAVSDIGGGVLVVGSVTLVADARILLGADRRKGAGRAR